MKKKELTRLDLPLVRDYLIKLIGEGEEFLQSFYEDLLKKRQLFAEKLSSPQRVEALTEEEVLELLKSSFPSRRKAERVLKETGLSAFKEAVKKLLFGSGSWEERTEEFVRSLRGLDHRKARDLAAELLHFTFPDRWVLWTSWVWDPETETGAVVFLKEVPPIGGRGREMFGESYEEFEGIYRQIGELLEELGVRADKSLFTDMFLATIYATYVDYMTLSTMHSAKGFFPPAGVMARRLLGLKAPVLYKEV